MKTSFKQFRLCKSCVNTIDGVQTKYMQETVIYVLKNFKCQND